MDWDIDMGVLQIALKKWGERTQLDMVQEELAELIVAISKYNRYGEEAISNLEEEMGDVLIMIAQIIATKRVSEYNIQDNIYKKMERIFHRATLA